MAVDPVHQLPTADPRSTAEVVRDVLEQTQLLVRAEIELAKSELAAGVGAKVAAVAAFVAAAVLALYGLGFLAAAAAVGLGNLVPPWLAILLVAVLFLAAAGAAAVFGRSQAQAPISFDRTKQSLQEDAAWAKSQFKR